MASGQPTGPAPQGQYPGYVPAYQPPHKPAIEYVKPLASDLILALGAVVGLFLLWLGWLIFGLADTGTGRDAGQVLKSFGLLVLTVAMMLGGVVRVDMERWVRVSMIIGAVLLVTWEGFWTVY